MVSGVRASSAGESDESVMSAVSAASEASVASEEITFLALRVLTSFPPRFTPVNVHFHVKDKNFEIIHYTGDIL